MTTARLQIIVNALSACATAMRLGRKPHGEGAEEIQHKRPTNHNAAPLDAASQNTGMPVFFYACSGNPRTFLCAFG